MSESASFSADAPFPTGKEVRQEVRTPSTSQVASESRLLPKISGHADLRSLPVERLTELANEIRHTIAETVCTTGGHLGSNFGAVELTIALHYVMDFSKDALILDVGHQCYPHKLLTGRLGRFHTLRTRDGVSGYPHPGESEYDVMRSGHAGTAISMGLGMAAADGVLEQNRRVVCMVGDSGLAAGVALEGLNYADHLGRRILVVLNDNEMSISKTVGSLAGYLNRLRAAPIYTGAKDRFHAVLRSIPFGQKIDKNLIDMVDAVKAAIAPGHLFEELGFNYFGPVDGHDIGTLISQLEHLKDLDGVTLLHVVTKKGKGLESTGKDTRFLHAVSAGASLPGFNTPEGVRKPRPAPSNGKKTVSFTRAFGKAIIDSAERDERVVAITAAMPDGTGLTEYAARFPDRFHDTGITEQHAVAFAGGLAKGGARPVVAIYSTFLQRGYDQIFHEVVLQDLPVVFAMDRSGLVGQDGPSHQGLYDISYIRTFPFTVLCAPRNGAELQSMLDLGLSQEHPFFIRYPRGDSEEVEALSEPVQLGKGEVIRDGSDVTLVGLGPMADIAVKAARQLAEHGVSAAVVNPRFVKPLDLELLLDFAGKTGFLVTIEEHQLMGGFGSAVLEAFAQAGKYADRVMPIGVPDRLIEHADRGECLEDAGLTSDHVVRAVLAQRSECSVEQ